MTNRFWFTSLCTAMVVAVVSAQCDAGKEDRRTALVRSVEQTLPSTVNIHTEKRQKSLDVVFSKGKSAKINGMGTGIIFDERGYIATNYHVVQDVETLRVTTFDGGEYRARVIAYDSRRDVAIIKIEPRTKLKVMPIGTSSDLMLGEDVIAIGNAFGYESTVTKGIVSHLSRDVEVNEEQAYENLIQIDAAINPGNSGGPLLNSEGEVIGMNVAIRAGAQRIGFAIPIDDARVTIARLMNIERHNNTYHGISTLDYKAGPDRKLIVQSTRPDSPGSIAGLKNGDIIKKAGETDIVDATDLERSLFGRHAGEKVTIIVDRDGAEEELTMNLASLSPSRQTPGRKTVAMNKPASTPAINSASRAWDVFGLKLATLPGEISLTGSPYRGGMKIVDVRANSPAQSNGIRKGDVLLGLHHWETLNDSNIEYVLDHPDLKKLNPLKFYILRDGETLFGHFRVASK